MQTSSPALGDPTVSRISHRYPSPLHSLRLILYQRTGLAKLVSEAWAKTVWSPLMNYIALFCNSQKLDPKLDLKIWRQNSQCLKRGRFMFRLYFPSSWKTPVQAVQVLLHSTHMVLAHLPYLPTYIHINSGNHWLFWRKSIFEFFHSLFWEESDYPC